MKVVGNGSDTNEDQTERAKSSDVTKLISAGLLRRLLKSQDGQQDQLDSLKESASTIKSAMGEDIKKYQTKHSLDKAMFAFVRKLYKMSDERLAYHLPNLTYYLEASGIDERARNAPPLPMDKMDNQESVEA